MARREYELMIGGKRRSFHTQRELIGFIEGCFSVFYTNRDHVIRHQHLADVMNALHVDLQTSGQRCTGKFELVSPGEQERRQMYTAKVHRGGIGLFLAEFSPLGGWRQIGHRVWESKEDPEGAVRDAFRQRANFALFEDGRTPSASDRCIIDGCRAEPRFLEYDHEDPTFDEIWKECRELITDEEVHTMFGWRRFDNPPQHPYRHPAVHFVVEHLKRSHPAVRHLLARQREGRWSWKCAQHHRNVTTYTVA